jgi:hypothetical protein
MKLAAFTVGGIDRASSRLRSFYLFSASDLFDLKVIRPSRYRDAIRCDAVHIQKIISYRLIAAIFIYRLFGLKVIFDIDDQPVSLKSFLGYYVALFLSSVICVDTEERKCYWKRFFSEKKIIVINDIADADCDDLEVRNRSESLDNQSFFWVGYSCNFISLHDLIVHNQSTSDVRFIISIEENAIPLLSKKYPSVEYIPWFDGVAYDDRVRSRYMVLNHNQDEASLMKSDNKMVLAILAGFIPIVSRTPAYERLAKSLNAEYLIFDNIYDVIKISSSLSEADPQYFFNESIKYLNANYSRKAVLSKFYTKILS